MTFVIAEMACSHEGEVSLAEKIIDASAASGADVVQLQIWAVASMMSPQRKEYNLLKKIELSQKDWAGLVSYSRKKYPELQIYVCVYEHASIEFIESLGIDGYKINSSDLSNPLVLEKVARTGKPINLSVGASTLDEIETAIKTIRVVSNSRITLMYGHQSFPTRPESVHMSYINTLKEQFGLPIGYQDHCDADTESAFWLPAASIGMDIDILEKHITHDRSKKGIDHESALNPDEFVRFVDMVRILDKAKGESAPRPFTEEEIKYREFQKKSIVASRDLEPGSILSPDDLTIMRAEILGISPNQAHTFIGKKITRKIPAYQAISDEDFK